MIKLMVVGFCLIGTDATPGNGRRIYESLLRSFKEVKSPQGYSNWQLDIKTCKAGCKNCVNGLVAAIASSQSSLSSIPPGGEMLFTLLL